MANMNTKHSQRLYKCATHSLPWIGWIFRYPPAVFNFDYGNGFISLKNVVIWRLRTAQNWYNTKRGAKTYRYGKCVKTVYVKVEVSWF